MALSIILADLADGSVRRLLAAHAAHCTESSPPESRHYLPVDALAVPEVTVWAATDAVEAVGVGALKALSVEAGEIKSMHTAAEARGLGVGGAILAEIEREARRRSYRSLWLETGTMDSFAAARAFYERHGFEPCAPFGDYRPDPHSICYTKRLSPPRAR
jgi:putative acetyltransferase